MVTGLGTVSSLGHDAHTFFDRLLAGECGIGPVTRFDTEGFVTRIAAEVRDFDPSKYWANPKDAKRPKCRYWNSSIGCAYGDQCQFAHDICLLCNEKHKWFDVHYKK